MRVTLGVGIENPRPTLQLSTVEEIIGNESKCNRCQYFSCHRAPIVTNRRYSEGLLNDERLPLSLTPNHPLHGYSQYSIYIFLFLAHPPSIVSVSLHPEYSVLFLYSLSLRQHSKCRAHTQKII